jgi:hypothetical protein
MSEDLTILIFLFPKLPTNLTITEFTLFDWWLKHKKIEKRFNICLFSENYVTFKPFFRLILKLDYVLNKGITQVLSFRKIIHFLKKP